LFPGDPTRPERIIILDGSGHFSLDALDWLGVQGIALVRLNWMGSVTVTSAGGYAANVEAWRTQMEFQADPIRRLRIARDLIEAKLSNSLETLRLQLSPTRRRADAIAVIEQ